ncbi:type VI secretion system amidase effector protein Tae4 [Ralstonia solanacearum]|uniref:type VI secretion system amidase effector protein Tae4 n=1 Tax=Ralstonia solanacearum TaxID=305 RepID=UPI0018D1A194|nr:type VI secretion system amidase effector protein Tae4 [Ralstonia solanacearum]
MTAAAKKAVSTPLKQMARVRTNTTKDSVCKIDVPSVKFSDLWGNYVTGQPYKEKGGVPKGFENQCAIRMSATLHKVGIEMKSFSTANVTLKPGDSFGRIMLDGKFTAVKADQLGSWLSRQPFCGIGKAENITGMDWESRIKGRTGIVMFDGYWTRDGESSERASGGHIDLWNGSRLTNNGVVGTVETFARFTLGIHNPWIPVYSDLRKSKTILFFEVK